METAGRPSLKKMNKKEKNDVIEFTASEWGALVYTGEREREREITHNCAQGYLEMFIHENQIGDSLGPIKKEREREMVYCTTCARVCGGRWMTDSGRVCARASSNTSLAMRPKEPRGGQSPRRSLLMFDRENDSWQLAIASYREEPLIFARARSFFQPPLRKSRARPSSSLSIVGSIPKRIS